MNNCRDRKRSNNSKLLPSSNFGFIQSFQSLNLNMRWEFRCQNLKWLPNICVEFYCMQVSTQFTFDKYLKSWGPNCQCQQITINEMLPCCLRGCLRFLLLTENIYCVWEDEWYAVLRQIWSPQFDSPVLCQSHNFTGGQRGFPQDQPLFETHHFALNYQWNWTLLMHPQQS